MAVLPSLQIDKFMSTVHSTRGIPSPYLLISRQHPDAPKGHKVAPSRIMFSQCHNHPISPNHVPQAPFLTENTHGCRSPGETPPGGSSTLVPWVTGPQDGQAWPGLEPLAANPRTGKDPMSSCCLPWPAGLVHEDFATRYSDVKPFEFGQMPGVISATAKFPLGERGY